MINKKNITGIILAGGKSSRMGSDKAQLLFKGKTFLNHVIDALKPLVDEVLIVSNNKEHGNFNFKRVPDTLSGAGPLAGLHAGLNHSNTDINFVLSCDVPLIQTSLLELILSNNEEYKDVIQIESEGKTHHLIALYKKSVAPHFLSVLNEGERRLSKAIKGLNVKTISIPKTEQYAVKNINSREDLKNIEHEN